MYIFLFFGLMWKFLNPLGECDDFFKYYYIKIIDLNNQNRLLKF